MAHAMDIGKWFAENSARGDGLLRVQKLTYFSHAWSLAWTGRPLVSTPFQAWPKGPVNADLYREHKHFDLRQADSSRLTDFDHIITEAIEAFYGTMSTDDIKDLCHDTPWSRTRGDLPPDAPSKRPIDDALVLGFYTRLSVADQDVPKRPAALAEPSFSVASVLAEEVKQFATWKSVHEELARA